MPRAGRAPQREPVPWALASPQPRRESPRNAPSPGAEGDSRGHRRERGAGSPPRRRAPSSAPLGHRSARPPAPGPALRGGLRLRHRLRLYRPADGSATLGGGLAPWRGQPVYSPGRARRPEQLPPALPGAPKLGAAPRGAGVQPPHVSGTPPPIPPPPRHRLGGGRLIPLQTPSVPKHHFI